MIQNQKRNMVFFSLDLKSTTTHDKYKSKYKLFQSKIIKCVHKLTSANTKAAIVITILPNILFPVTKKKKKLEPTLSIIFAVRYHKHMLQKKKS